MKSLEKGSGGFSGLQGASGSSQQEGHTLTLMVVALTPATPPYTVEVKTTGIETSLKEVFEVESELSRTIFGGISPQDPPSFRIFRKSLEVIKSLRSKCLHVLLLKSEGYKFPRNPNAHIFELYCNTYFFGPFVVATNGQARPYSLGNFTPSDLNLLHEDNQRVHRIYPPPYETSYPVMPHPEEKANDLPSKSEEDFFYMNRYKTRYCPDIATKHDWTQCIYAHRFTDYRRPPDQFKYSPEDCRRLNPETGECPDGDKCRFSHSTAERLYHPQKYKTSPCDCIKKKEQQCKRGKHCAFYHTLTEKRNPAQEKALLKKEEKQLAEEIKQESTPLEIAAAAAMALRTKNAESPQPELCPLLELPNEPDFEPHGKRHRWTVHTTQEKLLRKEEEAQIATSGQGGLAHVRSVLSLANSDISSLVSSFSSSKGLPYYTAMVFEERDEDEDGKPDIIEEIEDKYNVLQEIGTPTHACH